MIKSLRAAIPFVCLLIPLSLIDCSNGVADIQITGYVSQEIYNSMGMSSSALTYPYAYHVSIEVLNKGRKLTSSSVVGAFVPEGGKALTSRTVNMQDGNWVFAKGKKKNFDFSSNGYTMMLLLDSEDKELNFFFVIEESRDNPIAVFMAPLPSFGDKLPQYERLKKDKGEYGLPLVFTRTK